MRNTSLATLNSVLLTLVGISLCLYLAGCLESENPGPRPRDIAARSEPEAQTPPDLPPTAKTLYATAEILAKQGRDSDCALVLRRTIQEYPDFFPAYNSLAQLQMRQNRTKEAIDTISMALCRRPEDPVLLNNLGVCWLVLRDYDKALEMFTKAHEARPQNAKYLANMAVALGLLGRYDESRSLYQQVLSKDEADHNLDVLRQARMNVQKRPAQDENQKSKCKAQ